ncbi:MAG: aspartate--tRNA(Asn) ligase [Thermomicrobiales bacterium]
MSSSPSSLPLPVVPSASPPEAIPRTFVADLGDRVGERVRICGWLHHQRMLKAVDFLLLRDATGIVQVIVEAPDLRAITQALPHETVLAIEATVVAAPQAPNGLELHDPVVTVLGTAVEEPPVDLFRPEIPARLPTLLDHAAVSFRHPARAASQRLLAAAVDGFRTTLRAQGFVEISTPKLLGTAPEGGANVFPVDYFGRTAFLAQSPQLYKQVMVGALERVFETAPAFRAEPHDTTRHLSQFLSLDAELGFIRDHQDVMTVVTDVLRGMMASIAGERRALEAHSMLDALPEVLQAIPQVHFTDALAMVGAATGEDLSEEPDLAPAHERWLGDWARETHGSDWLFVTGYPMRKRPFYTHPDLARPEWSNSFDLLFRGQEIITGGQRLHEYDAYLAALAERGLDAGPFAGYLEAFRHGMPPHGGFALGVERMIAQLVGAPNVREVTLFPRDVQRLTP